MPAALGESTKRHCQHFVYETADGELYTSIYVRKEFIRRWVRSLIRIAFAVDFFGTVDDALADLEQDFSIREIKASLHAIANMLRENGDLRNTKEASKEFGRLAVSTLARFDRRFSGRFTNNLCGCQTGGKQIHVDYNSLLGELRQFVQAVDDFPDCPINGFLDFSNPLGRAGQLLKHESVKETKAGEKLSEFAKEEAIIDCRKCAQIGDAVIAIEQPKSWCLAHIDAAFETLCHATQKPHKRIESERATEPDVPKLY
jgi:hypothetical protein